MEVSSATRRTEVQCDPRGAGVRRHLHRAPHLPPPRPAAALRRGAARGAARGVALLPRALLLLLGPGAGGVQVGAARII